MARRLEKGKPAGTLVGCWEVTSDELIREAHKSGTNLYKNVRCTGCGHETQRVLHNLGGRCCVCASQAAQKKVRRDYTGETMHGWLIVEHSGWQPKSPRGHRSVWKVACVDCGWTRESPVNALHLVGCKECRKKDFVKSRIGKLYGTRRITGRPQPIPGQDPMWPFECEACGHTGHVTLQSAAQHGCISCFHKRKVGLRKIISDECEQAEGRRKKKKR